MNYDKVLNRRIKDVPPSGIRKFFDVVSTMKDAISLGVGEPDFTSQWSVNDAAIYSLKQGRTHYTANAGLLELREETCDYLAARFGLRYDPKTEIFMTVGASEGIDLALRALVEPGDEVLMPDPSYVSYSPGVIFAGGVPRAVVTRQEDEFRLTPEALRAAITPRTKALILPYPNNPTGAIMEREHLEAIAQVLRGTDIMVISDEIYAELTYGGKSHVSFAAIEDMRERTITLNGFSKAFAMTGWRMGYACAPAEILKVMLKMHQYTILCAPTAGQYAALEALKAGRETDYAYVKEMVRTYDRRRRIMLNAYEQMGLSCFEPRGAFYTFPCIKSTGLSSQAFAERLLMEQKVAVVPGTAFGESGEGYVRCSYATATDKVVEAMARMKEFVESIKRKA
ncbi:MAG: aminotransferase class I/II-fold pyridoxal phosphate-dependent enzyme [Clostridia bacterium]|nr:aminotransferase class I/II-fold pyridoxal phosphate-dependent enzyme [Clostridia bacterium]